ncbi:FAD-dependent oxidoreductase [Streptomyces cavernicola]|uniref:FAD-dependent oxidoreductase n=1 Tax=Streptomyces cavernicola TaxID=3043613 RepID=A0ABT6SEN4_9ACTN|nr:FAD-dependent oxidoreductase [Streptomyces sp. B-S-A6]MDI3406440.1 FAD-dependent oxidoreductase [Streptomyces sp. B-S-A6]
MDVDHSQYVVVGAGLAGAATAWQLAAAGHEVTIVERGTPADEAGSSHGSARIFRYAYPSEFYTRLVTRSRALWSQLEAASAQTLITSTGAVDWGLERDPAALTAVLEQVGIEHELLSQDEATARWPQFNFETKVLWHPQAGVIDSERSVEAMVVQAQRNGARLLTDWDLTAVERRGHGYTLRSADGRRIDAERVVIAAGGWLPKLLDLLPLPSAFRAGLPHIEVRQEQAYHFRYRENHRWPTFIHKNLQIQTYGLPGGRDADFQGQKVAEFNGGKLLHSAADQDGTVDAKNRDRVINYVRRHHPGLDPKPYAETTCLFTNTPNEHFVLDRCEGLTILSPCSGHGAKFAPLIGALAAGVATAADATAGRTLVPEPFLTGTTHAGATR